MSEQTTPPIGVSVVVRLKAAHHDYPAGTYALVIDQAPNGRDRYRVMIPGDPLTFTPHVSDLDVVQGVDPQSWWRSSKVDRFAAGRAQAATDARLMAQGWLALAKLDEHADRATGPLRSSDAFWCGPCSKFTAALLRGTPPAEALGLRCPDAQEWQRRVDAAIELAKAEGLAVGDQSKDPGHA